MAKPGISTVIGSENEEWRPIPGWEGHYEASSLGRIRSVDRIVEWRCFCGHGLVKRPRKGKILCPKGKNPYPQVGLTRGDGGRAKTHQVHTLVCTTFHGPQPTPAHEVAHWDRNPRNTREDNLRWATSKENKADKIRHGTHQQGEDAPSAKLSDEQIQWMRRHPEMTNQALSDKFGVVPMRVGIIMVGSARRRPALGWTGPWLEKSSRKPYGGLDDQDRAYIIAHPEMTGEELAAMFGVERKRIYQLRSDYKRRRTASK